MNTSFDKQCTNCKRTYRGDGHEGVCTQACYYKYEYAKRHNSGVNREAVFKRYPKPQDDIEKANEKWLENKPKKELSNRQKQKLRRAAENCMLGNNQWSGKQFKSVRG